MGNREYGPLVLASQVYNIHSSPGSEPDQYLLVWRPGPAVARAPHQTWPGDPPSPVLTRFAQTADCRLQIADRRPQRTCTDTRQIPKPIKNFSRVGLRIDLLHPLWLFIIHPSSGICHCHKRRAQQKCLARLGNLKIGRPASFLISVTLTFGDLNPRGGCSVAQSA